MSIKGTGFGGKYKILWVQNRFLQLPANLILYFSSSIIIEKEVL
jgi:hypothetical protein